MIETLDTAVETIQKLLAGDLPAPEPGKKQAGVGDWYYSPVVVGGDTPPPGKQAGGKPVRLWWLEWYSGRPLTPAEKLQAQIRGIDVGGDGDYWQIYVAQHRGLLHWWFRNLEDIKIKTTSSVKLQGDLPLIFATRKTPPDSVKVQAGIALYRQGWQDEAFVAWLWQWVTRLIGEEEAGLVTTKLLNKYYPATCSPGVYIKRLVPKQRNQQKMPKKAYKDTRVKAAFSGGGGDHVEAFSLAQQAARELGVSLRQLYNILEKRKFYTINRRKHVEEDGGPVVVKERRSFKLTPEVIQQLIKVREEEKTAKKAAKKAKEDRKFRAALVKAVAEKRDISSQAASGLVRRRLKAGKSLEEIARELLGDFVKQAIGYTSPNKQP